MNENLKTAIFAGIAAVLALTAYITQPRQEQARATAQQALVQNYEDPGKAASLEIVRYSEELGEISSFRVAKDKNTGAWEIPSHSNYPSDAETQMRDAGTMFLDFKALGVASEVAEDHKQFGVVEPDLSKLKPGDKGVGTLIRILDASGEKLVNLIIGHKVKNNPEQRFVRIPGMDPVYIAKIDPDKLSTKFEDWIDKDLLKVKTFDVDRLTIKDYSVVRTNQGFVLDPRMDVSVASSETDNKWSLSEFITYKGGKAQRNELLEDEELNATKLDELKNTLDDIKIVDVVRKPKGLGADLRAGTEFLDNPDNVNSLFTRGFFPDDSSGNVEIRAANGELRAGTKDGVDYILRFGNVAGSEEAKQEEKDAQAKSDTKLTRYLFVVAQVNESRFPEPQLEQVPELPEGADKPEDKPVDKPEDKPADKPEDKPADKAEGKAADKAGDANDNCVSQEDDAKDAKKKEPEKKEPEKKEPEKKEPEKKEPEKKDESPTDESKKAGEEPKKGSDAESIAKIKAERERIVKENQRKLDEHKEKRKKAEDKARELNARFADWYYVISEDVYKKVRLSRADILKEREVVKEEGFGVDAFRKLETEGVQKKADAKK